ncbi:MAG: hypothetical protein WC054_01110 [Candidatus Nanopelagicales bacterium]
MWAVLIDDLPVDLGVGGWVVRCQAKRLPTDSSPVQEWSTGNQRVILGRAQVVYGNDGSTGETSTVQLVHTASASQSWDPFSADFDIEIERGSGTNVERHTLVSGRITGTRDVTRA